LTVTSNDVANQAVQLIGDNHPFVTGTAPNFDTSPAGKALSKLYAPCVATIARQWGWDLARNTAALQLSGNVPANGWLYEYLYPANGIQVWQLVSQIPDSSDPRPVNWNVANTMVGGVQTKVIQTNLQFAEAVYNNNPNESTWDSLFREAVVRLLANELANAIAGRPDTAQAMIESGAAFEAIGEQRDS
jgi:hypothetical protein